MSKLAKRLIAENKKTKAKRLDLGNCGLTEVPEEVGDCVWLENLNLGGEWYKENAFIEKGLTSSENKGKINQINTLSSALAELRNLKHFSISNNPVTELSYLSSLENLESLWF